MNPAVRHLLWKEYRAHRQLWLILAAFPPCLGLLVLGLAGRSGVGETVFFASAGVGMAFAVASSIMSFALDEEDGTAIWTRMFPVGTRTLLASKLLFVVLGTSALIAATLGACAILCVVLNVTMGPKLATNPSRWNDAAHVSFAGINLLLISIWSSLRGRKVFTALFLCVGLFFVYRALSVIWDTSFIVPVASLISLAVLIGRAARVWHRGRSHVSIPPAATSRVTAFFPLRISRLLTDATSGWLLTFAATRSPASRRGVATLVWMELRQMVPFAILCLGLGTLFILTRYSGGRPGLHIPLFFAIMVLVIECGLRTFRHDQQRDNGLFWSHRGVSPGLVLLLRTGCWLSFMFAGILTAVFAEELIFQIVDGDYSTLKQRPTALELLEDLRKPLRSLNGNARPLTTVITWCVGGFVISSVCSCWIRRWIVAAFVAVLAVVGFSAWYGFVVGFGYPMWLTVFPLLTLLYAAVFFTRHSWMDRRSSRGFYLQQAAWIVGPCLVMIPVQRYWRMTEIPVHVASYVPSELEKMGYSELHDVGPVSDAWQRFVDVTFSQYPMVGSTAPAESPREDLLKQAVEAIDRIDEQGSVFMPPRLRHPWTRYDLSSAVDWVCSAEIERLRASGETRAACDRCVQAFRIQQILLEHAASHTQWSNAHAHVQSAMESFRHCVTEGRFSENELSDLLIQFRDIQKYLLGPPFFENRHATWQQVLFRQGYLWDRYQKLKESEHAARLAYWPKDLIEGSYSERYRMMQLMQFAAEMDIESELQRNQLEQWLTTSTDPETSWWVGIYNNLVEGFTLIDTFKASRNAVSASGTILALQLYHARHGEFPNRLYELEELDWQTYTDKDGREFDYFPYGFGQPLPLFNESQIALLHPDQPVLVSHGPAHSSLSNLAGQVSQIDPSDASLSANRVVFLDTASLQYVTHKNFRDLKEKQGRKTDSTSHEDRKTDLLQAE